MNTFISIFSCWNWAILQIYFCTLKMKYTSSILSEISWFPKFVTLKNNLNLYVSSLLWVHQEFSNELYFKYIFWICFWNEFVFLIWVRIILEVDFQNVRIYYQIHQYTWSRLSKLTNLHSKLEVYLKHTYRIDAFSFFKLKSILEVDFLNLYICIQTQKYTSNRLCK